MSATITAFVTLTASPTAAAAAATVTVSGQNAVYFEICWSILSTLGIFTALVGILVIGIVGFSLLALVPIINSIGCALGNGLCWYAYYSDYSINAKIAAAIAADVGWLIQEASLSFYSFLIVRTLLRGRERVMFHVVFWFLTTAIVAIRMGIIASRITLVRQGSDHVEPALQSRVNHLHVGYFVTIACAESWNAYFLLRKFYQAQQRRESMSQPSLRERLSRKSRRTFTGPESIYSRLARSTEIRLALLALIGIFRSITFTFQASAQSATNLPSQLDRFAACFECMFPIVFIVDLLASKLAFYQRTDGSPSNPQASGRQMSGWGQGPHKINVTSSVAVDFHNHDPFSREESNSNYSEDAKLTNLPPTVTIIANHPHHDTQNVSPTQPTRTVHPHTIKFSA